MKYQDFSSDENWYPGKIQVLSFTCEGITAVMATSVSANRKRASQHLAIGVYIINRIFAALTREISSWTLVKFVSASAHVISFISPLTVPCEHSLLLSSFWSRRRNGGSVWIESLLWSSRNPNFCTSQSCFLSWNWVCARACVYWCS